MDHFPLPPGKGHIRIPNMTPNNYIRGIAGFEGHPTTQTWSAGDIAGQNSFGNRSSEVEAFFQRWLYFGSAIEVFAISGVELKASDLLDSDRRYVST